MSNKTITVSRSKDFEKAFETLARDGGGTIELEATSKPYDVNLVDRGSPEIDAPVRITSADPNDPAVIADMVLARRENVTVDGVVFDSTEAKRTANHRDLTVQGSTDVTITDSVFRGGAEVSLDGTIEQQASGDMAIVRASSNVVVSDSVVTGYYHGIAVHDSDDVTITGLDVSRLQGDALRIGGAQDMLVEDNYFHDMLGTLQSFNHSDMIQIWGTNVTQNNERITIRENVISTGDGPSYQLIFGGNPHKHINGYVFEDIVVEGNVIHGAHRNMISISHTDGTVVRNNTLVWNHDTGALADDRGNGISQGWIDLRGGRNAVIEGNVSANIKGATGPNRLIEYSDPSDPDYFARHYVNLEAGASAELQDLSLKPGSPWDGKFGSPLTWTTHEVDAITAVAEVERSPDDRSVVTLSADLSKGPDGPLGSEAAYRWTFDDGTTATGATVTHDFSEGGLRSYTLNARLPGRGSDTIERTILIEDPALLRIDMNGSKLSDASSYASTVSAKGARPSGGTFALDGQSSILVDRSAGQIYSLDQFELRMTFEPEPGGAGQIFEIRKVLTGALRGDGGFDLSLRTTEGEATVRTGSGVIEDGRAHDIAAVYDGTTLAVVVDGVVVGREPLEGATLPMQSHGLLFGKKWTTSARGEISEIEMSAEIEERDGADGGADGGFDGGLAITDSSVGGDDPASPSVITSADFDVPLPGTRSGPGSDGSGRSVALGQGDRAADLDLTRGVLLDGDGFTLAFDLARESRGDGGQIFVLPGVMRASLGDQGHLTFEMADRGGWFEARSVAPVVTGTGWHELAFSHDAEAGVIRILVDGAMVAEAEGTPAKSGAVGRFLTLGHSHGIDVADGFVDDLRVFDDATDGGDAADAAANAAADADAGPARPGGTLASLDFERTLSDAAGHGATVTSKGGPRYVDAADGRGIELGDGASVRIERDAAFLHERDSFGFSFDLRRDGAREDGRVLHFNKALEARVEADGTLVFELWTDEGRFDLRSDAGAISARNWHAVEIGYDDAEGLLALMVDGDRVETRAGGTTAEAVYWGLTLGAQWGDGLRADLDTFRMTDEAGWL